MSKKRIVVKAATSPIAPVGMAISGSTASPRMAMAVYGSAPPTTPAPNPAPGTKARTAPSKVNEQIREILESRADLWRELAKR